MRQDSVGADPQVSEEGTHVTGSPTSRPNWNMPPERNLFSAKRINHCNDFVARVALEVVDSAWWKQQLRVKSAGSVTLPSRRMRGHRGGRYSPSRTFCANLVSPECDCCKNEIV